MYIFVANPTRKLEREEIKVSKFHGKFIPLSVLGSLFCLRKLERDALLFEHNTRCFFYIVDPESTEM